MKPDLVLTSEKKAARFKKRNASTAPDEQGQRRDQQQQPREQHPTREEAASKVRHGNAEELLLRCSKTEFQ